LRQLAEGVVGVEKGQEKTPSLRDLLSELKRAMRMTVVVKLVRKPLGGQETLAESLLDKLEKILRRPRVQGDRQCCEKFWLSRQ
jgi:hypothetical protein